MTGEGVNNLSAGVTLVKAGQKEAEEEEEEGIRDSMGVCQP